MIIDAATVIEDVLDAGASVRFRASGDSMLPSIGPGEILEIERVDPATIRRGDVVLARLSRGLTAHRVVRIQRDGGTFRFVMRGDNTPRDDEAFDQSSLLGRVKARRVPPLVFRFVREQSLALFTLYAITGLAPLVFAWFTVFPRSEDALASMPGAVRTQTVLLHWIREGYFHLHGLIVPLSDGKVFYGRTTALYLLSSFLLEKMSMALTGVYAFRLLALHNELVSLLTASLLALLAYRVATRIGATRRHAIVLGWCVQLVFVTFPTNLALYWEILQQSCYLPAAILFALCEERRTVTRRPRALALVQGSSVFVLCAMDFISGAMFVAAFLLVSFTLRRRWEFRRLVILLVTPFVMALSIYPVQALLTRFDQPRRPIVGSPFLYRSGLDGDTFLYKTHLDIAFGRDNARRGRPANPEGLFSWPSLFLGGTLSILALLVVCARGRVSLDAAMPLLLLTGPYVICAAVLSQQVAIHPYAYDVLLATPMMLGLFAVAPALLEARVQRGGLFTVIALFGAIWLAMFQLRVYAMAYPVIR